MQVPKRRGLALTIIGAVLMLLIAPAAAGIGIWKGVSGGMNAVSDTAWIEPGRTVHLTGVDDQTILVEGRYETGEPLPACDVTGPGDRRITVDQGTARLSMDWGGTAYTRAGTFHPVGAGDYAIDCSDHRAKVISSAVADDVARRVLVPLGIGLGIGVLAFMAGVVLLIVGIIKLVKSGQERSRAKAAAAGWPGYGPGGGQPHGQQPPYPPGNPDDPYRR
ncbi:hypothetical protein GCM10011492_37280 [Flexivirga endophytica]|uniref:Uncharacterized protein n=1 Tax=Flexivirga endophytica TaxID=1849103 RepID=A0A916X030_9MICO|nr:hypothetical protein [Flexivirga endophytica]GGB42882.1 hypothetical protein GCM10011492_37280 [Flexivirga endophytica]GHB64404.1 hypothetical protein GCM10008112_36630 [Flexivirga endophytica]